jgi:hypothetical protein
MKRRIAAVIGSGLLVWGIILSAWSLWLYRAGVELSSFVLRPGSGNVPAAVSQIQRGFAPAAWLLQRIPDMELLVPVRAMGEVIENLDVLLGTDGRREYVVLLQNNMELRPTGGFMGSYALLRFELGELTHVSIEDIYTPDGQIKGYVPEPKPITQYLFNEGTPGWRLRDANWHPDFVESAKAIEWFFREGGLTAPDGFAAVTLNPLVDLLRRSGELRLADYGGIMIGADNFYAEAQNKAETDFFPGSTQKRDFLGSVAKQMLLTITEQPEMAPLVAQGVIEALSNKELLVYIPDVTGEAWSAAGWDGSLRPFQSDFLMINEANVGITKANCCIRRSLVDEIRQDERGVIHSLTLRYTNDNPPSPRPPHFWGGGYKNYLRVIVPKGSSLISVTIDEVPVEPALIDTEEFTNHMALGFLSLVPGGESSVVQIEYQVPVNPDNYSLLFQKQTGIGEWPLDIKAGSRTVKKVVGTDELFRIKIK